MRGSEFFKVLAIVLCVCEGANLLDNETQREGVMTVVDTSMEAFVVPRS